MRQRIAAATLALAALLAATAVAAPPARVTIVAVFDPITYGENAFVNGQLVDDGQAGQPVALEQSPPPYTDWAPVAQTTSDAQGYYSFKLHPSQTMQYRTSSQGTPSEKTVQVNLAPRIAFSAAAAGKSSVRFSGTFGPALLGQSVAIQRRDSHGAWTTIATATLRKGATFGGRLRARHTITLRAFFAGDVAHLPGASPAATVARGSAPTKAARAAATRAARAAAASCRAPRVTKVVATPQTLRAGKKLKLRVTAAMPSGRIYALDVRWGTAGQRDHFTFAPAARRPTLSSDFFHVYDDAGSYTVTVRAYGRAGRCKRSSPPLRRTLRVA